MEVKTILLSEYATTHQDGTFSLLRGGIDNLKVASFPTKIRFSFVVILELLSTEVGKQHTAELDIVDADGNRILPQLKIPSSIPIKLNKTRYKQNLVCSNVGLNVTKAGKYSLEIGVDGHNLSSLEFEITQIVQQAQ